jgi:hypothetical protein
MAAIPVPGNKKSSMVKLPSRNPKAVKGPKSAPIKAPKAKGPIMKPLPIDEKIIRTMPITEKQLGSIKKMYGI